jgi:hypothetical protein
MAIRSRSTLCRSGVVELGIVIGECLRWNPTRFLGVVNGKYIYVHAQKTHWPDVFGYGHLSAAEGALETYRFNGRYQRQKNSYPIGDEKQTLEIQSVIGHKLPVVFTLAKKACETD